MAVLIGGHMGSGKSVLRRALYLHPKILITEGFGNFRTIDVSYWKYVRSPKLKWHYQRYHKPLSHTFIVRFLVMIWVCYLRCGNVNAHNVETVLRQLFPHTHVVGDTSVQYAKNLDRTVSLSNLQHVIVYRDCRDVAAEMERRKIGPWSGWQNIPNKAKKIQNVATVKKVAYNWLSYIRIMESFREKIYMIRYEDMATAPQAVLTALGHCLGVDPQFFQYDFIHANAVGDYKQVLSKQDIADILSVAGPTMERLGYI